MAAGIRVVELSKTFDSTKVTALNRLNLGVDPGAFVCICGPTGCGKTTLLRILAGLESPTTGTVEIAGRPVTRPRPETGMVFQQYSLLPWRDVLGNVALGLEFRGVKKAECRMRAQALLRLVGLEQFQRNRPYELSGGMQQRVAIARALVTDPDLLLLDEPFTALDERTRHRLQDELLAIWQRTGKTVVFVTHNIDEAVYLADRVVVMADRPGRIAADFRFGLARPRNRLAPEFITALLQIRAVLEQVMSEDAEEESITRGGSDETQCHSVDTVCCGR